MTAYEFLRFDANDLCLDATSFAKLPPSARTTFVAILREGPLSMQGLHLATGLPPRTVRFSLMRLCALQLVDMRRNLSDARTTSYFVHPSRIRPESLDAARGRAEEAMARKLSGVRVLALPLAGPPAPPVLVLGLHDSVHASAGPTH